MNAESIFCNGDCVPESLERARIPEGTGGCTRLEG
jgi:hypothetical protein